MGLSPASHEAKGAEGAPWLVVKPGRGARGSESGLVSVGTRSELVGQLGRQLVHFVQSFPVEVWERAPLAMGS